MSSKALLLLTCLLCAAVSIPTFEEWAAGCGRTYADDAERQYRRGVYNENAAEIAARNAQAQAEGKDTVFKPNCVFGDRTAQQGRATLHVNKGNAAPAPKGLRAVDPNATPPTSVDWRDQGMTSAVKHQQNCGSCWAFATAALYESFAMIAGLGEHDLSEEYILQCTTAYVSGARQSSCAGGYVTDSIPMVLQFGAPIQTTYPYISNNWGGTTPGFATTAGVCDRADMSTWIKENINGAHFSFRDIDDATMKLHVAYAPVVALLNADAGFQALGTGVYSGCPDYATSKNAINHAVVVVGYTENGDWIVKNSWGTTWGDNGYGIVSKDADCALKAYVQQINGDNEILASQSLTKFFLAAVLLFLAILY